jgi:hypothetical protein
MSFEVKSKMTKLRYLFPIAYLLMILISYVSIFLRIGRINPSPVDDILLRLIIYVDIFGLKLMSLIPVFGRSVIENPIYGDGFVGLISLIGVYTVSYLFLAVILFGAGYLLDKILDKIRKSK